MPRLFCAQKNAPIRSDDVAGVASLQGGVSARLAANQVTTQAEGEAGDLTEGRCGICTHALTQGAPDEFLGASKSKIRIVSALCPLPRRYSICGLWATYYKGANPGLTVPFAYP